MKDKIQFKIKVNNDLIVIDKPKLSDWEQYIEKRQQLLNKVPKEHRIQIEKLITLHILEVFKKAKNTKGLVFFDYDPFVNHPLIKKYFPMLATAGIRNIGKTTASHRLMHKTVLDGNCFMKMRNINDELSQVVASDQVKFFDPLSWSYKNAKSPSILDGFGNLIGWYRDINTIGKYRSVDFPKLKLIVWDEFSSCVNVAKKFDFFAEFVVTAQRHQRDLQIILQANFVNQHDEVLQKLGVGLEKLAEGEIVKFNWITGSMMIFIPADIYTSVDEEHIEDYLGYRMSLASYELYKKQFGGGFANEELRNVVNIEEFSSMEPLFNIYYSGAVKSELSNFKLTMYYMYDMEGNGFNLLTEQKGPNAAPILCFDNINKLKYKNAIQLDYTALAKLINAWHNDEIKVDSTDVYEIVLKVFSEAKKQIEKNEFFIDEVATI